MTTSDTFPSIRQRALAAVEASEREAEEQAIERDRRRRERDAKDFRTLLRRCLGVTLPAETDATSWFYEGLIYGLARDGLTAIPILTVTVPCVGKVGGVVTAPCGRPSVHTMKLSSTNGSAVVYPQLGQCIRLLENVERPLCKQHADEEHDAAEEALMAKAPAGDDAPDVGDDDAFWKGGKIGPVLPTADAPPPSYYSLATTTEQAFLDALRPYLAELIEQTLEARNADRKGGA